jgi:endoglucanase
LDQLLRKKVPTRAGLLLTRAEEVGFVGTLAALKENYLDSEALYINIECSSVKAGAQMGAGPIIRVGDRMSIFNPEITAALATCAEELQTQSSFRYQRKLMDSGSCEATPMVHQGLKIGAVALPLDNYHNIGENSLKPEQIAVSDALHLVDLFMYIVQRKGGALGALKQGRETLTLSLDKRFKSYLPLLEKTTQMIKG